MARPVLALEFETAARPLPIVDNDGLVDRGRSPGAGTFRARERTRLLTLTGAAA
jgi:hypothetical protein